MSTVLARTNENSASSKKEPTRIFDLLVGCSDDDEDEELHLSAKRKAKFKQNHENNSKSLPEKKKTASSSPSPVKQKKDKLIDATKKSDSLTIEDREEGTVQNGFKRKRGEDTEQSPDAVDEEKSKDVTVKPPKKKQRRPTTGIKRYTDMSDRYWLYPPITLTKTHSYPLRLKKNRRSDRPHRRKRGTVSIRNIRRFQNVPGTVIPRKRFREYLSGLLQDILSDNIRLVTVSDDFKMKKEAREAFIQHTESSLFDMINTSYGMALNCGRKYLSTKDVSAIIHMRKKHGIY